MQGAVEPFFHYNLLGSGCLFDLVKRAIMDDGKVVPDRAFFLDAKYPIEFSAV